MTPKPESTKEQRIDQLMVAHQKALTNLMHVITKEQKIQREKSAAIAECSITENELRELKSDILSPII